MSDIIKLTLIEAEFEKRWKKYPVPVGKKDALRHWKADIKNRHIVNIEMFNAFLKKFDIALDNYVSYIKRCWSTNYNRRFKDGSSFFYNWEDYIEPPDKKLETEKTYTTPEERKKADDNLKTGKTINLATAAKRLRESRLAGKDIRGKK